MRLAGSNVGSESASKVAWVGVLMTASATIIFADISAPPARSDVGSDLRDAVTQMRGGASCGPLHPDSIADQVAAIINKSYSDWLDHTSTYPPITDPMPGLKELGYRGTKGKFLGGVSKKNEAEAITGVLVEGYAAIPDCSYTDYGVNMSRNDASGYSLAAVVLGGA